MVVSKKQFVLGAYTGMLVDGSCLIFSTQGAVTLPSFAKGIGFTRLNVKLGNLIAEPALSLAGLTYCLSFSCSFDVALKNFVLFCVLLKKHSEEYLQSSPFFLSSIKLGHLLVNSSLFNEFTNYVDRFSPVNFDVVVVRSGITLTFFGIHLIRFVSSFLHPFSALFRLLLLSKWLR